eukprot:2133047-Rhodomonas_salina.1
MLILIIILNDGTMIAIGYVTVAASKTPERGCVRLLAAAAVGRAGLGQPGRCLRRSGPASLRVRRDLEVDGRQDLPL